MTVGCPRCPTGTAWRATGVFNASVHVAKRAELVCEKCGRTFCSGLPEALAAADAVLAEGTVAPAGGDLVSPAPRLICPPPRSQDTMTPTQLRQYQNYRRVRYAKDRDRAAKQTGRPPV